MHFSNNYSNNKSYATTFSCKRTDHIANFLLVVVHLLKVNIVSDVVNQLTFSRETIKMLSPGARRKSQEADKCCLRGRLTSGCHGNDS